MLGFLFQTVSKGDPSFLKLSCWQAKLLKITYERFGNSHQSDKPHYSLTQQFHVREFISQVN